MKKMTVLVPDDFEVKFPEEILKKEEPREPVN